MTWTFGEGESSGPPRPRLLPTTMAPQCQSSVLGPLCAPFKRLVSELTESLHEVVLYEIYGDLRVMSEDERL